MFKLSLFVIRFCSTEAWIGKVNNKCCGSGFWLFPPSDPDYDFWNVRIRIVIFKMSGSGLWVLKYPDPDYDFWNIRIVKNYWSEIRKWIRNIVKKCLFWSQVHFLSLISMDFLLSGPGSKLNPINCSNINNCSHKKLRYILLRCDIINKS